MYHHNPDFMSIPAEQLAQSSMVRLTILPDAQALFQHAARSIADEIQANNAAGQPTRLILPVGPTGQYPILVDICNREGISWKNTFTFNMDEYCDWQGRAVPETHPMSFRGAMRTNLFEKLAPHLRIPEDQTHFPDPLNLDELSRQIEAVGGIDTCYGGIGFHGHVAFNEPPVSRWFSLSADEFLHSKTRIVQLEPDSIVMNSIRATGGNTYLMPTMAVTMGMDDIFHARRIRLYCPGGAWQRASLRIALMGDEDVDYPATLLQKHPDYQIITDVETAQPATI